MKEVFTYHSESLTVFDGAGEPKAEPIIKNFRGILMLSFIKAVREQTIFVLKNFLQN